MKGQLYIGDDMVAETVEVVSPPQSGDLVIYQGKRLRVREIAHNIEKKKLQIMCHVPAPVVPVVEVSNPYDPDTQTLQYAMQKSANEATDKYLEDEAKELAE